jgi:hypothetical protein
MEKIVKSEVYHALTSLMQPSEKEADKLFCLGNASYKLKQTIAMNCFEYFLHYL